MKTTLFGISAPKKECADKKCPFHSTVSVKSEFYNGRIIRKDTHHSATIEWYRKYYVPKYERYETRRSRIRVHNPACIDAQVGQRVLVARTRPLSKMKNFVVLKVEG